MCRRNVIDTTCYRAMANILCITPELPSHVPLHFTSLHFHLYFELDICQRHWFVSFDSPKLIKTSNSLEKTVTSAKREIWTWSTLSSFFDSLSCCNDKHRVGENYGNGSCLNDHIGWSITTLFLVNERVY